MYFYLDKETNSLGKFNLLLLKFQESFCEPFVLGYVNILSNLFLTQVSSYNSVNDVDHILFNVLSTFLVVSKRNATQWKQKMTII